MSSSTDKQNLHLPPPSTHQPEEDGEAHHVNSQAEEGEEDNIVYVDAHGEPLDPAIEASCRMAADFAASQQQTSTAAVGNVGDDDEDEGMATYESGAWFQEELAHAQNFFRAYTDEATTTAGHNAAQPQEDKEEGGDDHTVCCAGKTKDTSSFFAQFQFDESTEGDEGTVFTTSADELSSPTASTCRPEEEEGGMEDEDGMFCSRAYSDALNDEDWILEEVLRRRVAKEPSSYARRPEDDDDEDAINRKSSSSPKSPNNTIDGFDKSSSKVRPQEYLIKWKFYADPTWEPKEWLEDQGWAKELAAFDKARKDRVSNMKAKTKEPLSFRFDSYWQDWKRRIVTAFSCHGMQAVDVMYCAPEGAVKSFLKQWNQHSTRLAPTMLYHGTRAACVPGILKSSLIVPGSSGVRVLNGSVHGVGIYTARDAGFSKGYSDQFNYMFVCAGLIGSQYKSVKSPNSSIVVFSDASLVVPVWLVRFDRSYSGGLSTDELVKQLTLHSSFGALCRLNPRGSDIGTLPSSSGVAVTRPVFTQASGNGTNDLEITSAILKYGNKKMTKKMLRQAPRAVKEVYRTGQIQPK